MMRIGVVLLALTWAGLALAGDFDAKKAAALWDDANMQCRQGETKEGPITNEESDRQCQRREVLTILLQTHHYCFDVHEQEWGKCKAGQE
ncbi:hypothetical protein [Mesorhizobium carmichaelinearum]|uniref:hypothetical protein n=1 Tax=Mesorhizobium carmichaelinearum TaxID=1208188 RepID=UPI000BA3B7A9|nr:hypothetical protein [Mesorhizobium carmichaelinearum]